MEWRLFADLAETAGDRRISVDVSADGTVGDALDALLDERPALRERILDDAGELHSHVNVLRNGANLQNGLGTELESGDELALFPPVSGG